eukprot:COSAG01_NODE_29172_length_643_cov_1.531250_1_plen_27_part_01
MLPEFPKPFIEMKPSYSVPTRMDSNSS